MRVKRILSTAIRHYARRAGITEGALRVALNRDATIQEKVLAIQARCRARGGRLTRRASRQRLDEALPVARQLTCDLGRGEHRRRGAAVDEPTLEARFSRQIKNRLYPSIVGGTYSGSTRWVYLRGDPDAHTTLAEGAPYSSGCKYLRTDAVHTIHATLTGLRRVAAAGLPYRLARDRTLILDATAIRVEREGKIVAVTIVDQKGKAIRCKQAFVADQGGGQFHVAKTERAAVTALRRAAAANVPFSGSRVSAPDLQKTLGWCGAGIRNWCERHGVRRNLVSRLQRGARPQAIVRLVRKHGGPDDEYDRRLLAYLGAVG